MSTTATEPREVASLPRHAALCGGAGAGGGFGLPTTLGIPTIGELIPLVLLLGLFIAAGAWMFRRWGRSGSASTEGGEREAPVEGDVARRRPAFEPRRPAGVAPGRSV